MRYLRAAAGVLTAVVVVLAGTATTATGADATHYVALGDSYSSGTGTRDYLPDSGRCMRGAKAYPPLWARSHHVDSFAFDACAGATTEDLVNDQLGDLDGNTSLVTLTIGGNDVGFAQVIRHCLLNDEATCGQFVDRGERQARAELPAKLDRAFRAIRSKAPNADVVVLGYPHINEPGACAIPGYTEAKRERINQGADLLDETIAEHARAAGLHYVDPRDQFSGHAVCSTDPWINGPTLPLTESFHPNTDGHALGYLPVLDAVT
jgi:lysophospholipase L1-like esterase